MQKLITYCVYLSVIFNFTTGLYFHIGETERKCFIEEIPDETTVIGKLAEMFLKFEMKSY